MGRTFLVLSQVYVPDPASVGQHVADAAAELVKRGHRVLVLTADRGYDDPSVVYPKTEVRDGVEIRRLPWCSFGKRSIVVRLLGGFSFVLQAFLRGLFVRDLDTVVVSTSPPMASVAAVLLSVLRRARMKLWIMDLNPDQTIALGLTRPGSPVARAFDLLNRVALRRADDVVVLDRFMADRVNRKVDVRRKMTVLPPWPLDDYLEPVPHERNPFRAEHGLEGKLVVMYSGNHGPSNPIGTILQAAERLADEPRLVFVFVGGGIGKREVEACRSPNVRSLPYQPLSQLKHSLSAADVHLVTMGDAVVGIVHPCKVYGAMAVARPVLLLGPDQCHIADIIGGHRIGWRIAHGDVDGAVRLFRELLALDPAELTEMGRRARRVVTGGLGKAALCARLVDVLERGGVPAAEPVPEPAGLAR